MLRNIYYEFLSDWPAYTFFISLIFMLSLIVTLGFKLIMKENETWNTFYKTHDCKMVAHMSGSISTGIGVGINPSGQIGTVITTTPTSAKTGYLCNDGVTYWR